MTTWYRVECNEIKEVEVEKETDKCIWIRGCRVLKERRQFGPAWQNYYKTKDDAIAYITKKLTFRIEAAEIQLQTATDDAKEHLDNMRFILSKAKSKFV